MMPCALRGNSTRSEPKSRTTYLAVERGVIVGAFEAVTWRPADPKHFPQMDKEEPGRWGFDGHAAPEEIRNLYEGRRVPDELRPPGAANPIRYVRATHQGPKQ